MCSIKTCTVSLKQYVPQMGTCVFKVCHKHVKLPIKILHTFRHTNIINVVSHFMTKVYKVVCNIYFYAIYDHIRVWCLHTVRFKKQLLYSSEL